MEKKAQKIYSLEEILRLEEASNEKWEYYGDHAIRLSRGTPNHSLIQANLNYELKSRLKGKESPCRIYSSDLGLALKDESRYFHADLSIFCEKPLESKKIKHALTNPSLIIEVLSKSTESRDRGTKQLEYMNLPSLHTYILVDQFAPLVNIFSKMEGNVWTFRSLLGKEEELDIPHLGIRVPLKDMYEGVAFTDPEEDLLKEEEAIYRTKLSAN